ncbi:hypothetical protein JCM30471_19500 [Desulfuromonas carbonis]
MAGERILVIDDAEGVRKLLRASLAKEGFAARFAGSGEEGLEAVRRELPDLILLDLMLPAMDGLEVCRRLKAEPRSRAVPVIMLTGRGEEADMVRGLELGADDYIVKPFSPRVLIARLRAVLRRRSEEQGEEAATLRLHDLVIDPTRGEVRAGEELVPLSHPEFRFLQLLAASLQDAESGATFPAPASSGADLLPDPASLLEQEGMTLFALNRLAGIAPLFDRIPESLLQQSPWLAYYGALARFQSRRGDAAGCLEAARSGFATAGNRPGELLATAQILLVQTLFPDDSGSAATLALAGEELAAAHLSQLSAYAQIHVAQCLALAGLFRCGDDPRVAHYQELALTLGEEQGLTGFGALAYFCSGYQLLRRGDLRGLLRLLEEFASLLQHPQTSSCERLLLRLLQLYALLLQGDDLNRQRLLPQLEHGIDPRLLERSLVRLELGLLDIAAVLQGSANPRDLDSCQAWAEMAPRPWAHRFLSLGALLALREGDQARAGAMLAEARSLLALCKNPFDLAWCGLLLGGVGLQLDDDDFRADLMAARAAAAGLGNDWLADAIAGVLLLCDLQEGEDIGQELADWLAASSRAGGLALRFTPREIRQRLLEPALARDRRAARPLAASLDLVLTDGNGPVPLLDVQTLGGIAIRRGTRTVIPAEALTPAQRELLALLVSVPEMKLSQEEVQLDFWPDSPPEKARSSFDSLLLRLRKTLDTALAPFSARDCLQLQKGILCLENVRVDARIFAGEVRLGLDLVQRREYWQAGNAFARAHALWKGPFMPGSSARDLATGYREELDLLFVVGMQNWAELLIDSGQIEAATEILLQALRTDRTNDKLVRTLCRCHLRTNNPLKARQVMQDYAATLRREAYSSEEIDQILATFPTLLRQNSPPA